MGCSCSSFGAQPVVAQNARVINELELTKYKAMMSQEEQLAEEDATRAKRVTEWVKNLEEVPEDVLKDALEQERAFKERQQGITVPRLSGSESQSNSNEGHYETPGNDQANGVTPKVAVSDESPVSGRKARGSRRELNAVISTQSDGRRTDHDVQGYDHVSDENGQGRPSRINSKQSFGESGKNISPTSITRPELNLNSNLSFNGNSNKHLYDQEMSHNPELRDRLKSAGVFEAFLQVASCVGTERNLRKEFESIDVDKDNVISLNEFLFACYAMGTGLQRNQIDAIFKVIDENGDGVVQPEEFFVAFQNPNTTSNLSRVSSTTEPKRPSGQELSRNNSNGSMGDKDKDGKPRRGSLQEGSGSKNNVLEGRRPSKG
mmetsp:Transcript_10431/g.16304  ORF Transcript_10431/g.16304 Transcript_10431/m.16304 type:complete len:376 (+) Transcript_10431:826-1953(+)|eukprot:CAMPEP_0184308856 /NCGR_PEP_ID=MMETSP1049-20130417/17194_1 /TAXON_ID=77928 /ORGANISM="Proteomonas sulcata, Strain CCMP704" /LENGTH=375 /DNA_ID=CAMNT_0026621621 /DNA_START=498 /DNA_END=1625 /DNA_ORIENTATION=+